LNWQGAWDAAADYATDDAVSHLGSSWRARRSNTGVVPVEGDDWTVVAQKGDDAPQGGTVTEVSGTGPITVTDPTTTPTISLGLVPAVHGGTGLSSPGAAGSFLRSSGGVWTSGPLSAPDLPGGSLHYIQNSTSPQAGTSFHVEGTGRANVLEAAAQFNLGGHRVLSSAGTNNLFAGRDAGAGNATGTANAFFGQNAGRANDAGSSNAFIGFNAGAGNTTGGSNTFVGDAAGFRNAAASDNAFVGFLAGFHNTASHNVFVGSLAGADSTTGGGNVFVGFFAGRGNRAGGNLTLLGAHANVGADNLSFATALGAGAVVGASNTVVLGRIADTVHVPGVLSVSGALSASTLDAATRYDLGGQPVLTAPALGASLFVGHGAGAQNPTGTLNSFFGRFSGAATTTGDSNSFFGALAGQSNTTGRANAFFGSHAGRSNTVGERGTFVGHDTGLRNTTGSDNAFFGFEAGLFNSTASLNAFLGASAGRENSTGSNNSFVGAFAGAKNITGGSNSFFGMGAGVHNVAGFANTFIGRDAGRHNTAGTGNTAMGNAAGFDADNATGNNNTLLGSHSQALAGSNNATAIGHRAQVTVSDAVVLGGITGVNSGRDTNVGIGTTAPRTKLHVAGGRVYVDAGGQGVVLRAPGGACFELTVTNTGALTTTAVACP
jgi:hypothetical protein